MVRGFVARGGAGWMAALAFVLLGGTGRAAPITYPIIVDTSSLAGQSGIIEMQFNPAFAPPPATVVVSGFFTDGTLGSVIPPIGSVSGDLNSTVTINSVNPPPNIFDQNIVFGNTLQFNLTFSGPGVDNPSPPPGGNLFTLYLLDELFVPLVLTTDPRGLDALMAINTCNGCVPEFYGPPGGGAPLAQLNVPEPGGLLLMGLAGAAVLAARRRRAA